MIDKLKKQLIVPGFNLSSGSNFLYTGEGSDLFNVEKYFVDFLGTDIKKSKKNNMNKDKDTDLETNFVSCLGALKIIKDGWETEAIPKMSDRNIEKIGFFSKIFGIH